MISKKTINAIEVCVCLATYADSGYVTTGTLSPKLGLSVSYLENILKILKDHDLVSAMKGPGGGYRLRGDAAFTTVWEVAQVFEQMLEPSPEDPLDVLLREAADYELGLEQVVQNTLQAFTLADFVSTEQRSFTVAAPVMGRFKFKPLAPPFIPKVPNSVFQLHMCA